MRQPIKVCVFPVRHCDNSDEVLLLRRCAERGGWWQPVTGALENNETIEQAAARELFEETALRAHKLINTGITNVFEPSARAQARFDHPPQSVTEHVFVAIVSNDADVCIDAQEHVEFAWVSHERALTMLHWQANRDFVELLLSHATACKHAFQRLRLLT